MQPVFAPEIDRLLTLVEEGARASQRAVERFIEPAQGTLARAISRRHHLVFGRRGSGKSSLLFKAADTLAKDGHAIAFVDLEPFKGHHYPDVLLSVLIATLAKYRIWLAAHSPRSKTPFWQRFKILKHPPFTASAKSTLLSEIDRNLEDLKVNLHLSDDTALTQTLSSTSTYARNDKLKEKLDVQAPMTGVTIEASLASAMSGSQSNELKEETKRSKQDYLHRKVLDFQAIFRSLSELTGYDSFLFLDDLYHIRRADQPHLLDYFHRLAKNNGIWLKVGTIKNRSSWYVHSPQPLGLKVGDDADDINLDLTLEKFSLSREFLAKILAAYGEMAKAPSTEQFLSDGGLDRLVIASGGVTRDFLGIFRKSITEARERLTRQPDHPRGPKIGAEDVNLAAGSYGDTKREEFQRDTLEDRRLLEDAFEKVRLFCLSKTRVNVFLVDQDIQGDQYDLLQELIDLRLVHHVRSRVTVGNKPGRIFRALLLDLSQYTGERRRRDVSMLEFWDSKNKDVLRKPNLIYDPSITTEELKQLLETDRKMRPGQADNDPSDQTEMEF